MQTTHWLLPSTYGVVRDVLEAIDRLTLSYRVTRVALSLCLKRDHLRGHAWNRCNGQRIFGRPSALKLLNSMSPLNRSRWLPVLLC